MLVAYHLHQIGYPVHVSQSAAPGAPPSRPLYDTSFTFCICIGKEPPLWNPAVDISCQHGNTAKNVPQQKEDPLPWRSGQGEEPERIRAAYEERPPLHNPSRIGSQAKNPQVEDDRDARGVPTQLRRSHRPYRGPNSSVLCAPNVFAKANLNNGPGSVRVLPAGDDR